MLDNLIQQMHQNQRFKFYKLVELGTVLSILRHYEPCIRIFYQMVIQGLAILKFVIPKKQTKFHFVLKIEALSQHRFFKTVHCHIIRCMHFTVRNAASVQRP